ncbi:MAG: hypothetical protein C0490_07025 [Marivirga sp.]|nr:hypothetical protein [Marivirga sp.]
MVFLGRFYDEKIIFSCCNAHLPPALLQQKVRYHHLSRKAEIPPPMVRPQKRQAFEAYEEREGQELGEIGRLEGWRLED